MLNVVIAFFALVAAFGWQAAPQPGDSAKAGASVAQYEVARIYDDLMSKNARDRGRAFTELSSSMKAAVWSHHLLTAIVEHPEFTEEQRSVIQYALSVISPQLFDVDRNDPHWPALVDQPLQQLTWRAIAAFPPQVARELFAQLGPDQSVNAVKPRQESVPNAPNDKNSENGQPQSNTRAMRAPSDDVSRTYEDLLSMSTKERVRSFTQMQASMKSAVWAHRLRVALAEHPEFTIEQRTVVQEALNLLTSRFYDIDHSSPEWADAVDAPLRRLADRAKAAFGVSLARELFTQLGPESTVSRPAAITKPQDVIPFPNLPSCNCSSESDWCNALNTNYFYYYCLLGGCYASAGGCGTLWRYDCVGMCNQLTL